MSRMSESHLPTDKEFLQFQQLILDNLGIYLPMQKKALLANRWWKRLNHCNLSSYESYYKYILSRDGKEELNLALELITTNETYFFREQKHFDYLENVVLPKFRAGQDLRIWSAAASTGEEPYSIAMLLADTCPARWELVCSDVNETVLEHARVGIYSELRTKNIPREYLRRFCRKGIGPQEGFVRVGGDLRNKVNFFNLNLHHEFPDIGRFDVVFLRNVLIYFENDIKEKVLDRIAKVLKPNGILFVGHSESLHGVTQRFTAIQPAIYRLS